MAIKEVVMARYSVATTKNNLSSLIDKALAGEEVVITRHGKPTVSLSVVSADSEPEVDIGLRREWSERLQRLRDSMPPMPMSYLDMKRLEQDEWERKFDR
jgi:prevent-host-death family protein